MSPTRRHWFPLGTFSPHPPETMEHHQPSMRFYSKGKWSPDTDIYEVQEGLVIIVDIAGITRKEISLALENKVLIITGMRQEPHIPGKKAVHRLEIDFGNFEKRFRIPAYIDEGSIEASYENGFLYLKLPRFQSKTIDID